MQALQHGAGEREGDVDGSAEGRQRQEEVEASQQRPLYLQDVSAWRLRHSRPEESTCRSANVDVSGTELKETLHHFSKLHFNLFYTDTVLLSCTIL